MCIHHCWVLAVPSAAVENLNVTVNYNGVPNLVRIFWDHIPVNAWNGDFGGYLVSMQVCVATATNI